MPHWPKKVHGIPNICLRSALFGLVQRGKRRAVKGEKIAAVKGHDIRYTGWQLDQGDFDVLGQALHLQAQQPGIAPGSYLQFTAKAFLISIGRQPGKSAREWLKDSFRRLTATALEVNIEIKHSLMSERYSYVGSLIDEFYYQEQEHSYRCASTPSSPISLPPAGRNCSGSNGIASRPISPNGCTGFSPAINPPTRSR